MLKVPTCLLDNHAFHRTSTNCHFYQIKVGSSHILCTSRQPHPLITYHGRLGIVHPRGGDWTDAHGSPRCLGSVVQRVLCDSPTRVHPASVRLLRKDRGRLVLASGFQRGLHPARPSWPLRLAILFMRGQRRLQTSARRFPSLVASQAGSGHFGESADRTQCT